MNFKLPDSQIEKLNSFKERLDSHDTVVEGSKNDEGWGYSASCNVAEHRLRTTSYKIQGDK